MSEKLQRPRISFVSAARREAALRAARRLAFEADWLSGAPGLRRMGQGLSSVERDGLAAAWPLHEVVESDRARLVGAGRGAPVVPSEGSDGESGD